MPQAEILSGLRACPVFEGVKDTALRDLAENCTFWRMDVGEHVRVTPADVPLLLITKGCVAAVSTTGFGQHKRIVLALLMPTQLMCEFEYFGNMLPETAGLRAVDETEIISIPAKAMTGLMSQHPRVLHNMARALVSKINVCNFHLEAASQTQGDKKIATMLSGFINIPEWTPRDYRDVQRRSPMRLTVVWDVDLISKFLSSDDRTVWGGLAELVRRNLIEIEWLDERLAPVAGVELDDLIKPGRRNRKVNDRTRFRVTIKNPDRLEHYCGD